MRDFGTWDSICQQGSDSSIVEWTGKAERNFPQVLPVLHVYSLNETQYCKVIVAEGWNGLPRCSEAV